MLADVVAQLQVLMASVQSIATTVGQPMGQLHSLQTEVTVMKNTDNEDALGEPKFNSARLTPYLVVWKEEQFSKPPDAFSLPSVVVLAFLAPRTHHQR